MGVELYFVKREDGGGIEFPCWTADGEAKPKHVYYCVGSLKWAQGDERLAGSGVLGDRLTPGELVQAAAVGLRNLLNEYLAIHADYRGLPGSDSAEPDVVSKVISQLENEWVGGDESALEAVRGLAREAGRHHELFLQVLNAGRRGFHGYWSY